MTGFTEAQLEQAVIALLHNTWDSPGYMQTNDRVQCVSQ
jgi:hypothetical protein